MAEKRSDYRRQQSRKKGKKLLYHIRSAFADQDSTEEKVDVNPEFQRTQTERRSFTDDCQEFANNSEPIDTGLSREDKSLRLKKRLNRAILIVFVLIILVLLALFHL